MSRILVFPYLAQAKIFKLDMEPSGFRMSRLAHLSHLHISSVYKGRDMQESRKARVKEEVKIKIPSRQDVQGR